MIDSLDLYKIIFFNICIIFEILKFLLIIFFLAIYLVKRFKKAEVIKKHSLKILKEKFTAYAINEQDIILAINKQRELINSNNSEIISSIFPQYLYIFFN